MTSPVPPSGRSCGLRRPLRADARRNRDRLLDAATAAFTEAGVEVPLEDIARKAGVGIGTLYRHFPTRDHLVEMVYRHEVDALCRTAAQLGHEPRADVALETYLLRAIDYLATKRGLSASLKLIFSANAAFAGETAGRLPGALKGLVDRAVAEGVIRQDVDYIDVNNALSAAYMLPDTPDWRCRAVRLVTLLMAGLRQDRAASG